MSRIAEAYAAGLYPESPGAKVDGPSREAARAINACDLQYRVLLKLRDGPATADEVADALGLSVLAIRPRFSELLAQGFIVDSGARRKNKSGRTATVWRVA